MLKELKNNVSDLIYKNRVHLYIFSFIAILGIILGAYFCNRNFDYTYGFEITNNFFDNVANRDINPFDIFIRSFIIYGRYIFIIWLSKFSLYLVFLIFLGLLSRGFGIGYTVGCLCLIYGIKGFWVGFLIFLLGNIVFLPTIVGFSTYCFNISLSNYRTRKNISHKMPFINSPLMFVLIFSVNIICCLTEAYIIPSIIMPLCINF